MAERKKRTKSHIYADIATKHFALIAAKTGFTTSEGSIGTDYGIDVTLYTFDSRGHVDNEEVKIQIKASHQLIALKGRNEFPFSIAKKDLDHWLEEIVPVNLIRHDVSNGQSYWVYVQRYFETLPGFSLKNVKKTCTIRIPQANILNEMSMKQFRKFKESILKQSNKKVSHA